jgi:hypothetical protein
MASLGDLTVIGSSVACCGLLFLLICIGLVVWYAVRGPKPQVTAGAPEPVIQSTIAHPTAAAPAAQQGAPVSEPPADETPHAGE